MFDSAPSKAWAMYHHFQQELESSSLENAVLGISFWES